MKDVILFLTSPSTEGKKQLSLINLRQLKKLNKDIIILSTNHITDKEFHDIAKYIIVDENKNIISKKTYHKMMGYSQPYHSAKSVFHYLIDNNRGLNIVVYQDTNYLNVYKNTKNIISFAVALKYENFFYVEDDHYFSNTGIDRINKYFTDVKSLNAIYFTNKWQREMIRSHFWFGNCKYFYESILDKFPECTDDMDYNHPYFTYYELFLHTQMYANVYNKNNVVFESFDKTPFNEIFGSDSKLNQHDTYEYQNSDISCNILYNFKNNQPTFFFRNKSVTKSNTQVVVYKNNTMIFERLLKIENDGWIIEPISIDGEIKVEVNGYLIKTFNLNHDNILLNGYIS
jgi:hypothetical protein